MSQRSRSGLAYWRLSANSVAALSVITALAGCASPPRAPAEPPTLAGLPAPDPRPLPDAGLRVTPEQTIAAYRRFIDVAVDVPQRAEVLRRLGDLEMDAADRRAARAPEATAPDYSAARARYEDFLKTYPKAPQTDRVLYQLARAQEQAGELEAALQTLTQLTTEHPGTRHTAEAQFRRGEMLFATRDYAQAEGAYAAVLRYERRGLATPETTASPLVERALYMQGWSLFKLNRLDEALQVFFEVLDIKLAGLPPVPREELALAEIRQLTRADRELLDDTLRVIGIGLANGPTSGLASGLASGQGSAGIARYIDGVAAPTPAVTRLRESYQFRVYESLAELYLKQDRIKDAADTLEAFVRLQPLHPQAPQMLARVAQIYTERSFTQPALAARRENVRRYGAGEPGRAYARANPTIWRLTQPQVKADLAELARHHHALSQSLRTTPGTPVSPSTQGTSFTLAAADVDEAARWYRELLTQFADAPDALHSRFLLAELLFENRRWAEAAAEYERVAAAREGGAEGSAHHHTPRPAVSGEASSTSTSERKATGRSADAGYTALLAYAELERAATDAAQRAALQRQSVASALRFAQAQPRDARTAAVLVRAAEQLQALGDSAQATEVARRALALSPAPADDLRRAAWMVVALQAEDPASWQAAEQAYAQVLALTDTKLSSHAEVAEKLAATIYRQGAQARDGGRLREAVGHFERATALAALAAQSAVRASAQFDAAAALLALQDWPAAARTLEDFRRQQASHALQSEVAPKLALAYEQMGRFSAAAGEFERIASAAATQAGGLARSALWRAAELHGRAAESSAPKSPLLATSIKAWERYLVAHAQPLQDAVQAQWQLAALTRQDGQPARANAWLQAMQLTDATAGSARTQITRTLGGRAALMLAEPVAAAYRQVPLSEPLARQFKLKKARFEDALKAYAEAAAVDITEIGTAATFHSAALYQDFGRALLESARPKKLGKAELEQYSVMLEEQAFPFEEQAIALHEANARRAAAGVFDAAVRDSYTALARLKPARWGKVERGDAGPLNQQGIAQRHLGRFEEAQRAYEAAIAQDAQATAPLLNLAILHDLYLGDAARASALYRRCLELSPADAPTLHKWLAELKTRKPAVKAAPVGSSATAASRAAQTEAPPKEPL